MSDGNDRDWYFVTHQDVHVFLDYASQRQSRTVNNSEQIHDLGSFPAFKTSTRQRGCSDFRKSWKSISESPGQCAEFLYWFSRPFNGIFPNPTRFGVQEPHQNGIRQRSIIKLIHEMMHKTTCVYYVGVSNWFRNSLLKKTPVYIIYEYLYNCIYTCMINWLDMYQKFVEIWPPPRPCSSGVAILPCSQGDPEDPVTLNEVVGVVFKLFKHPLGSIGIQWKSWIQLVFWKCVVIICYLCWPPWHFCVQKSGFPIKEYQQEHKNNAVRRNMNIYEYIPCNLTGRNFFLAVDLQWPYPPPTVAPQLFGWGSQKSTKGVRSRKSGVPGFPHFFFDGL